MVESGLVGDLPHRLLTRVVSQCPRPVLGQRGRQTDGDRGGGQRPADGVGVLLGVRRGVRLDDHAGPAVGQRFLGVVQRTARIAGVVQTVEEGDQVEVLARVVLGGGDLEADPVGQPLLVRDATGRLDGRAVEVEAVELRPGKARAISVVE